jgi:hypothetical protein
MQQVALARQGILEGLMHYRPHRVVRSALTLTQREQFPEPLQETLEESVTLQGVIDVIIEDDWLTGLSRTEYQLISGADHYLLHFIGETPELEPGAALTVQALRSGRHLVVLPE